MPLFVDDISDWGSVFRSSTTASILSNKTLAERTRAFIRTSPVAVNDAEGVCCLQAEAAQLVAPGPGMPRRYVGSIDTTTCVIALLFAKSAVGVNRALAAHIDGASTCDSFLAMVQQLLETCPGSGLSGSPLELSIVGGCDRTNKSSAKVVDLLLQSLHKLRAVIKLQVACVWDFNTTQKALPSGKTIAFPIVTAACIDLNGVVAPATFSSPGTHVDQRVARLWTDYSGGLHQVFDQTSGAYLAPVLGEFAVDSFYIVYLLTLNDAELLRQTSTSPECEPLSYLPMLRSALRWMMDELQRRKDEKNGGASKTAVALAATAATGGSSSGATAGT